MIENHKEINPLEINESIFKLIGTDWMLLCAGTPQKYNMMTASWGNCGILWNKPIATVFIRPQRYTFGFAEEHDFFTLSFFDEKHRDMLQVMGSQSGRDISKMQYPGLDAFATPSGSVAFKQARLILECKKLYADDIKPGHFIDPSIEKHYPRQDYHRFYIGEILTAMRFFD